MCTCMLRPALAVDRRGGTGSDFRGSPYYVIVMTGRAGGAPTCNYAGLKNNWDDPRIFCCASDTGICDAHN